MCQLRDGNPTAAIESFEASIRVNPRNPEVYIRHQLIGFALLMLGRHEESVAAFLQALASNQNAGAPQLAISRAGIAAALALSGDLAAARRSATEAMRLSPTLTVRGLSPCGPLIPVIAGKYPHLHDGLRLAGIRDHADETFDPGLPADNVLRTEYEAPTPTEVPGARTIRTKELAALLRERQPVVVLDTSRDGDSIPGAIGLWGAGVGGTTDDAHQDRLRPFMRGATTEASPLRS